MSRPTSLNRRGSSQCVNVSSDCWGGQFFHTELHFYINLFNLLAQINLKKICYFLLMFRSVIVQVRTDTSMVRDNHDGTFSRITAYFYTSTRLVTEAHEFDIASVLSELNAKIEDFNRRGSGFVLERITRFVLAVSTYRPLHGSTFVPTPKWLMNKHCIVNVKNSDNKCFLWSIISALYPAQDRHPDAPKHYVDYQSNINTDGLEFPTSTKQIPRFENNNREISVNVLSIEEHTNSFCVEYLSPHRSRTHHVNLLLLEDESNPSKRHYTHIKNMSALVAHRTKHNGTTYVCNSCLHPFSKQDILDRHIPYCIKHNPQQVIYPDPHDEKDCTLEFRSVQKQHPVPIYLAADFESFLSPVERAETDESSGLNIIDEHVVSGFCTYRVTPHVKHQTPPFIYSGPDPMTKFYDHVMEEAREISRIVRGYVDMLPLTDQEAYDYEQSVVCGNCGGPFTKDNKRTHHHDHVSGRYLFAACNCCNLQLKAVKCNRGKQKKKKRCKQSTKEFAKEMYEEEDFFVPVLMHNLRSYDSHFIIKHFQRKFVERRSGDNKLSFDDVQITPINSEKYLQFQIGNLRFLDSYQFLSTSLDQLVQLLLKSGKQNFVHTSKYLGNGDDVFAKGVYPYAYMSSREKFAEKQLPPIESFHDTLKDEPLKQEDYVRAQETWSRYGMQNMQAYHDHYLMTDVLLLADVFERFRGMIMSEHNLDCLHFITLPSLAWAMALKYTGVKLDLITDPDAYLMLENSLRGGIASISQRYTLANNPHVAETYDDSKPSRYITYLDANSLYATAQCAPLPVGNFRFLEADEIANFDLDGIEADAEVGYIVECDLEYPAELHDLHNDYPMAPEHLTVSEDMLSPFAVSLFDPSRPWRPMQKLVPNLFDKKNYVAHYRNLQLYKNHGLVVSKIHRILSFTQARWMMPWIELCNRNRRAARSDFESDLAKLEANATFGKSLEDVRNRVNVRLIADQSKALKAIAKASFRHSEIVNSDLVMVRGARTKVKLNKPIAVWFSILEISKFIMYEFYYDHLKATYPDRCSLLSRTRTACAAGSRLRTCTLIWARVWISTTRVTSHPIIHSIRRRTVAFSANSSPRRVRRRRQNSSV